MQKILLFLLLSLALYSCTKQKAEEFSLINTAHLDHLYEEISFNNRPAAIIHIYAEYPDYKRTEAVGEGIACVDDIARAAVFYVRHYKYSKNPRSLQKAERLLYFILGMQADNGFFYNFIDSKYQINKTHINSEARADWWTWRALWALAEALPYFSNTNPSLTMEMKASIKKTLQPIGHFEQSYPETVNFEGFVLPTWLPAQYAADQASVLLKALIPYQQFSADPEAEIMIHLLADGVVMMQAGDSLHFPFNAFMSWGNIWHAYGNSQADALLEAGVIFTAPEYGEVALKEVKHFYPWLMKAGYLKYFKIKFDRDSLLLAEKQKFEQIAYGIRPMVFASLGAYKLTGEEFYARQAAEMTCWLLGKNIAGKALYDPQSGRCYDGIDSADKINFNSGAESTVEALLTILEIEKNAKTKQMVHDYYKKYVR